MSVTSSTASLNIRRPVPVYIQIRFNHDALLAVTDVITKKIRKSNGRSHEVVEMRSNLIYVMILRLNASLLQTNKNFLGFRNHRLN